MSLLKALKIGTLKFPTSELFGNVTDVLEMSRRMGKHNSQLLLQLNSPT